LSTNQSLARGLQLLGIVDAAPAPVGIRELARSLGVSASIAQRLVNTLSEAGFLEQVTDTRRYRLGPSALALGAKHVSSDRLFVNAAAELQRLAETHHLNGYLGVLQGHRIVYLHTAQSRGAVVIRVEPGSICSPHSTALGKALLSTLTEEEASAILGEQPYPTRTAKTITDPALFAAELARVRKNGLAMADEEHDPGVTSIGAPVRDRSGRAVAAISVAFIRSQVPRSRWHEVGQLVRQAAERCSASIGEGVQPPGPADAGGDASQRAPTRARKSARRDARAA
jgi:DNA-binding IclR family transcriptional regulator